MVKQQSDTLSVEKFYIRSIVKQENANMCYDNCIRLGSYDEEYDDFLMMSFSYISDAIEFLYKGISLKFDKKYTMSRDIIEIFDNNIKNHMSIDTKKIVSMIIKIKTLEKSPKPDLKMHTSHYNSNDDPGYELYNIRNLSFMLNYYSELKNLYEEEILLKDGNSIIEIESSLKRLSPLKEEMDNKAGCFVELDKKDIDSINNTLNMMFENLMKAMRIDIEESALMNYMTLKSKNKIPADFIDDMTLILSNEGNSCLRNHTGEEISHIIYIVNRYYDEFKRDMAAI